MHERLYKISIREDNPDHVIIHAGTNELDLERQTELMKKCIIDGAKGIRTNIRTVSILEIVQRKDNFNNRVQDVNNELSKMCREVKLDYITHKNINPNVDLNKSKLNLNRNGSDKIGKNYLR